MLYLSIDKSESVLSWDERGLQPNAGCKTEELEALGT
jgi:hypothetical protein